MNVMNTKTTATWRALDLYNGVPESFIKHHIDQGYTAIFPKIGNGLNRWHGLDQHFIIAKNSGLETWAWWYLYGYEGEGIEIGEHAEALGVSLLALDIETHWEKRAGFTQLARERKAKTVLDNIRKSYTGSLALCSWWKPSLHKKTPFKVFLNECEYNMPQMYWISRYSSYQAEQLIVESLSEYDSLTGIPHEKTIPVLSSFGATYGVDGDWWKTTLPQMESAFEKAETLGCEGATWYSTDYLLGKAGHENPKEPETEMLNWIAGTTPNPLPQINKTKITVAGNPENYTITEVN